MKEILLDYFKKRKNITIPLTELQSLFPGNTDYKTLVGHLNEMENRQILIPIKSHQTNRKNPPLYNSYRINKAYFKDLLINQIQTVRLKTHESIRLEAYFSLDEAKFQQDLPYIEVIDKYIRECGLPLTDASAPERSYEIFADEKWIDFKGGKAFLQRIGLWDDLRIVYNVDPLMIAVNPQMMHQAIHKHLVVENKATFYDCLESLANTDFTSLVYGAGWKIVSNINLLAKQLGLENCKNQIYYFGDLDFEGISIWHILREHSSIVPAIPFYQKLLTKPKTAGKINQRKNMEALEEFKNCFSQNEGQTIKRLLEDGYYYPQEGLTKEQIRKAWGRI